MTIILKIIIIIIDCAPYENNKKKFRFYMRIKILKKNLLLIVKFLEKKII